MYRTLLTGAVGGIIGPITEAIGTILGFIANTFLTKINKYIVRLGLYLTPFFPHWSTMYSHVFLYPLPFFLPLLCSVYYRLHWLYFSL